MSMGNDSVQNDQTKPIGSPAANFRRGEEASHSKRRNEANRERADLTSRLTQESSPTLMTKRSQSVRQRLNAGMSLGSDSPQNDETKPIGSEAARLRIGRTGSPIIPDRLVVWQPCLDESFKPWAKEAGLKPAPTDDSTVGAGFKPALNDREINPDRPLDKHNTTDSASACVNLPDDPGNPRLNKSASSRLAPNGVSKCLAPNRAGPKKLRPDRSGKSFRRICLRDLRRMKRMLS